MNSLHGLHGTITSSQLEINILQTPRYIVEFIPLSTLSQFLHLSFDILDPLLFFVFLTALDLLFYLSELLSVLLEAVTVMTVIMTMMTMSVDVVASTIYGAATTSTASPRIVVV